MSIEKRIDYKLRNIDDIEDVQTALEKLTHDLQGDALERVVSFNHTYLVITRRVKNEIKKGSFTDDEFLTNFDTVFAHYYFSALRGYIRNETIPPSWRVAFEAGKQRKLTYFIVMALGVNAHVNNDIPFVLLECSAKHHHYKDYRSINAIISASLNEVISSLGEDKKLYGPKNYFLTPFYRQVMKVLIRYWRRKAWLNFLALRAGKSQPQDVELSAYSTAKLLTRIPV